MGQVCAERCQCSFQGRGPEDLPLCRDEPDQPALGRLRYYVHCAARDVLPRLQPRQCHHRPVLSRPLMEPRGPGQVIKIS
jgi:hypothetical protein